MNKHSNLQKTAEKILYLLKNPEKAKAMGREGHEKVKNEFLLINHVEKYLDLFNMIK